MELGRDGSEALCNVSTFEAVLHNLVAKIRRSLLETTDAVANSYENTTVVESEQKKKAKSSQASEGSTETDGTKDQWRHNFSI